MKIRITADVPKLANGQGVTVGEVYQVDETICIHPNGAPSQVFLYVLTIDGQPFGVRPGECEEIE